MSAVGQSLICANACSTSLFLFSLARARSLSLSLSLFSRSPSLSPSSCLISIFFFENKEKQSLVGEMVTEDASELLHGVLAAQVLL